MVTFLVGAPHAPEFCLHVAGGRGRRQQSRRFLSRGPFVRFSRAHTLVKHHDDSLKLGRGLHPLRMVKHIDMLFGSYERVTW